MSSSRVDFGKITFKNPVVMASGTFGFGKEYGDLYDISKLGGISTKGITLEKRDGNKGIRVWETPSGMMNSVGLENPGVEGFLTEEAPYLEKLDTRILVNISGSRIEDYVESVRRVEDTPFEIIELNISCPNVKSGGMAFGTNADSAYAIVKEIRKHTKKMLMVKLSPNVGDIAEIASACVEAGADAISLINTIQAMAVDVKRRKIIFDNTYAGLSGPAIRPIALRMVHQVARAVDVPIMGMGGIVTGEDAISFIMAGASCIQVGTANFMDLRAGTRIIEEIETFMDRENIKSLSEITGIL
jgi:dihydroorotate dehydrogenase (NAD+) catalytic subunit